MSEGHPAPSEAGAGPGNHKPGLSFGPGVPADRLPLASPAERSKPSEGVFMRVAAIAAIDRSGAVGIGGAASRGTCRAI